MIGKYYSWNIDIRIYNTYTKKLLEGNKLECITYGHKEFLIQLRLTSEINYDEFKLGVFIRKNNSKLAKLK